tara:strand:- start:176 stop:1732 length:1557 start_codon:yes stop_codon:yes gene_type:complete
MHDHTALYNLDDGIFCPWVFTAAEIRELDRIVIEEIGISGYELMQRAGRFGYDTLKKMWPDAKNINVICGCGNNAGDGYVLAKLAIEDGKRVKVFNCFSPEKLEGDAEKAYQDLLSINPDLSNGFDSITRIEMGLSRCDVIVDAIFGTGLKRDIEDENIVGFIKLINNDNRYDKILSIDIPSGLNADTGSIMGVAVNAEVTATFMGIKRGMLTLDGCEHSGQIVFDHLDIPFDSYKKFGGTGCFKLPPLDVMYHTSISKRKRSSHKGNFGHVLVIGGEEGYLGAAQMAAEASMRVGSGLVSVATRKSHASQLSIAVPEIMSHGVESLDELMPLIKRANVIAIGPGLGQSEWAKLLFARVLESDLPIIIDADALNLLAEEEQSSANWLITPHPGEAARLLKTDVTTIQTDRFQSARDLHEKYLGPVVLKGAGSIVTDLHGNLYVCNAGNPGMSSGGMGDVLTGVIAGLVAQGTDIETAAQVGVLMHASAGDMAASSGERGMMATDLMPHLRELANPNLE